MNRSHKKESLHPLLQAEGLVLFIASLYLYHYVGGSWVLFALLFFAPDICFIGYAMGSKVGVMCYNIIHTEIGPTLVALIALLSGEPLSLLIAIIWFSHINFDRMIGCGLKYIQGGTHLGSGPFKKIK